jgi:hypothetical protein
MDIVQLNNDINEIAQDPERKELKRALGVSHV